MRAKIQRGRGMRGLLEYALGKGELLETVGLLGRNPAELSAEFGFFYGLHKGRKPARPVYDIVLSWPTKDVLNRKQIIDASRLYLEQMGFKNNPFVIALHLDTNHIHVHLVGLQIGLDGLTRDSYEHLRSRTACVEIEQRCGFTIEDRSPRTAASIDTADGETATARRAFSEALEAISEPTFDALAEALQARGWTLEAIHKKGSNQIQGIGVRSADGRHYFKASGLSRGYSYAQLQKTNHLKWRTNEPGTQTTPTRRLPVDCPNRTR
jgi:hypothetical protein